MINGIIFKKMDVLLDVIVFIGLCVFLFSNIGTSIASEIGLMNVKQLNNELDKWIILDARPKKEWLKEHIPGSISFSWEDYTKTDDNGVKYKILPPYELANKLGGFGINESSKVVVYGDADTSWGGEGWVFWAFKWLGHKGEIKLLLGGIQEWKKSNFLLEYGEKENKLLRTVQYSYKINSSINISTQELEKNKDSYTIIDTRSILEWLKGHIPGAKRISWDNFFKGKERKPINSSELRDLLKKHNINLIKPIVYYCTGGIRSGYAWMVHTISGLPTAINYEGGFEEWEKLKKKKNN